MNIFESLRVALRGLAGNKMRTVLTMLGGIIGVAVVILVVAIGQGATQRVTDAVNSLGTNMLSIWSGETRVRITAATRGVTSTDTSSPGASTGSNQSNKPSQVNRLTLEDAKMIAVRFKQSVAAVAPQVRGNVQIKYNGTDSTTNISGVTV